jgi:predicted enzyme related to lactoylglutathione lyase
MPEVWPNIFRTAAATKEFLMRIGSVVGAAVFTTYALGSLITAVPSWAQTVTPAIAVGPQYDTTHVYVAPADMDRFAVSFLATFGGQATKPAVTTITPTPSRTIWQALRTPVGSVSLFGFETPIPYPFGGERTGYLVSDLDGSIEAARTVGADILVAPFPDPIGRDVIIQWPGGVNMQLYMHNTKASYAPLQTIPENRVYVSPERVAAFTGAFLAFSHGKVAADEARAPGVEIGRQGNSFREVRLESGFGKLTALVTDGHLPYPYGRETTGYEVGDLSETIAKAKAAGAAVLVEPYNSRGRNATILQFPGGPIVEVHAPVGR